jgi:hypothetical protein
MKHQQLQSKYKGKKAKYLKAFRIFYEIIGGICIILTFVFAYFDYGPKISVEVNNELSLQNTLALKYKINNDSLFSIQNVKLISHIIEIVDSNNNKFIDNIEIKTVKEILGNDYKDIIFQGIYVSSPELNSGIIEIIAIYESSIANKIPFINKTFIYKKAFKAIKDKNKNTYWLAI